MAVAAAEDFTEVAAADSIIDLWLAIKCRILGRVALAGGCGVLGFFCRGEWTYVSLVT